MLENLKDMLTEKQDVIDEILARRLQMEKETGIKVREMKIAHVSDLFKEAGEL